MKLPLIHIVLLMTLVVIESVQGGRRPTTRGSKNTEKTESEDDYDYDSELSEDDLKEENYKTKPKPARHNHHHGGKGNKDLGSHPDPTWAVDSFRRGKKKPPKAFTWLAGPKTAKEIKNVTDEVAEWFTVAFHLYDSLFRGTVMPILDNFVAPYIKYAFGSVLSNYVGPFVSEFLGPMMGGLVGKAIGYGEGDNGDEGRPGQERDGNRPIDEEEKEASGY